MKENRISYGMGYMVDGLLDATGSSSRDTGFTAMDIYESSEAVFVDIELAGIEPKDVSVMLHGNKLVIEGAKKESQTPSSVTFYCAERSFGGFRRVFLLSTSADSDNIEASHKNGILKLRIPKTSEIKEQSLTIKVKVHDG